MNSKCFLLCTIFATVLFSGCVTTSEPVPFGRDSFIISVDDISGFGQSSVLSKAVRQANDHCASLGKVIVPRNTSVRESSGGIASASVIYSCVDESDPEYIRPRMEKEADTVIKIK